MSNHWDIWGRVSQSHFILLFAYWHDCNITAYLLCLWNIVTAFILVQRPICWMTSSIQLWCCQYTWIERSWYCFRDSKWYYNRQSECRWMFNYMSLRWLFALITELKASFSKMRQCNFRLSIEKLVYFLSDTWSGTIPTNKNSQWQKRSLYYFEIPLCFLCLCLCSKKY